MKNDYSAKKSYDLLTSFFQVSAGGRGALTKSGNVQTKAENAMGRVFFD